MTRRRDPSLVERDPSPLLPPPGGWGVHLLDGKGRRFRAIAAWLTKGTGRPAPDPGALLSAAVFLVTGLAEEHPMGGGRARTLRDERQALEDAIQYARGLDGALSRLGRSRASVLGKLAMMGGAPVAGRAGSNLTVAYEIARSGWHADRDDAPHPDGLCETPLEWLGWALRGAELDLRGKARAGGGGASLARRLGKPRPLVGLAAVCLQLSYETRGDEALPRGPGERGFEEWLPLMLARRIWEATTDSLATDIEEHLRRAFADAIRRITRDTNRDDPLRHALAGLSRTPPPGAG